MTAINTVAVETPHGVRTFELYHGDLFALPADLVVISTHHNLAEPPTGQVVRALQKRFHVVVKGLPVWIDHGDGVSACSQVVNAQVPFQHLLTMRIAKPSNQTDPQAFYDRAIQATFASIATLEFMGRSSRTIALPVLAGQRIVDYGAAVGSLLRYAFQWLRQSRATDLIRYFVYNAEELPPWDEAMNACLGRSYLSAGNESVVRGLCQEIVSRLDTGSLSSGLVEVTNSLRHALAHPERLCVQTIATLGRKLAEWVTEQLCRSLGLPLHRELVNNIEAVRKTRATADWIISYLHSLRIFGNEGVHALAAKQEVPPVPSQLSSEDLASILCAVRVVLNFWTLWGHNRAIRSEALPPEGAQLGVAPAPPS